MKSRPTFIADAMLGSLARKLRIFGFDTLYVDGGDDAELEALSRRERRIILTADRRLVGHAELTGVRVILVDGRTDRARLRSVLRRAGVSPSMLGARAASRCAVCNGELATIARREAAEGVPPKVFARHRLFFRCASCCRLYWRGKHWDRLRSLSNSLKTKDLT